MDLFIETPRDVTERLTREQQREIEALRAASAAQQAEAQLLWQQQARMRQQQAGQAALWPAGAAQGVPAAASSPAASVGPTYAQAASDVSSMAGEKSAFAAAPQAAAVPRAAGACPPGMYDPQSDPHAADRHSVSAVFGPSLASRAAEAARAAAGSAPGENCGSGYGYSAAGFGGPPTAGAAPEGFGGAPATGAAPEGAGRSQPPEFTVAPMSSGTGGELPTVTHDAYAAERAYDAARRRRAKAASAVRVVAAVVLAPVLLFAVFLVAYALTCVLNGASPDELGPLMRDALGHTASFLQQAFSAGLPL